MEFECWVRAELPVLVRLATALCGSTQPAEDLVQDVLVKAHARWEHVQQLDHPTAYLRRMLVNEHLSWRRRLASAARRDLADRSVGAEQPLPFDQRWVERDALVSEVNKLPARQRAVIVLRYLEELSTPEIAAALGCSESTVRAHTTRALQRLRVSLPHAHTATSSGPSSRTRRAEERHAH